MNLYFNFAVLVVDWSKKSAVPLFIFILGVLWGKAGMAGESKRHEVWLLGGQSNMQGNAKVEKLAGVLEWKLPFNVPHVFFWNGTEFDPLVIGETITSKRAGEFGPEIGFAMAMATPTTAIYLVKYSASGMPLHHGIDGNRWVGEEPGRGRRNFYPGVHRDDPNTGTLYSAMRARFETALRAIRTDGIEPEIGGFLWMQGEQDAKHQFPARSYSQSLNRLRQRLDEDLGAGGKMPIIFGQVLPYSPALPRFTFRDLIREKMAAADRRSGMPDSIPWAWMVATDGFELQADTVHYDHLGQWKLGQAMGEIARQWRPANPSDRSLSNHTNKPVRINQLRLLGTHNSYHIAPDSVASGMISLVAPEEALAIDCTQTTITDQLSHLSVRHFELDLYRDPAGKLFANPLAYQIAQRQQAEVPKFDPERKLASPGIKILHSPDFDFRTTVYTLEDALREVSDWSNQNRQHVPIFLLLELKSDSFSPITRPLIWDNQGFGELAETILSIFPMERILLPEEVQGDMPTLRDAVLQHGWPTLDSQRGKVAFLLDNEDSVRDRYLRYSQTHQGGLLFCSVDRDHPAAAWMKRNDPVAQFDDIVSLVRAGFLVRTRADTGTQQARQNDVSRRERALASGAQLISTDFPQPDQRFSDYEVRIPLSVAEQ